MSLAETITWVLGSNLAFASVATIFASAWIRVNRIDKVENEIEEIKNKLTNITLLEHRVVFVEQAIIEIKDLLKELKEEFCKNG